MRKQVQQTDITPEQWMYHTIALYKDPSMSKSPPKTSLKGTVFRIRCESRHQKSGFGQSEKHSNTFRQSNWNGVRISSASKLLHYLTRLSRTVSQNSWTSLILTIFKVGSKNDPGNYRTIMISPVFTKLVGGMVERKISKWTEKGKKAKEKPLDQSNPL